MLVSCSPPQLMVELMWLCIAVGSLIIGRGRQKKARQGKEIGYFWTQETNGNHTPTAPLVQPNPRLCFGQTTTRALTGLALVGEGHLMLVALSPRHAPGAALCSPFLFPHPLFLSLLSLGRAAGLSFDILLFPAPRPYIH